MFSPVGRGGRERTEGQSRDKIILLQIMTNNSLEF